MKLHLIDDDEDLHDLLKTYFEDLQIELTASERPNKGIEYIKTHQVDLVILDLMLPEMDGFEVCKKLREYNPDLPIIMLTAKGDDFNKIVGLELGADDYMAKPFNPRELFARIKTILRRFDRAKNHKLKDEHILYSATWDISLDLDSRQARVKEKDIDFTVTEFDLLKSLMENVGIVQSRDSLMNKVKGVDFEVFDRSIDVYISKLRQKLGDDPKNPEIIKTVWGVGYIFAKF
ncbi:MAG: response regulator transcription factor [Candidatus Sericytochromatia bacterium]|nr:response regulator transcription factor [Candidatus Sericytochromatia bacterium]